MMQDTRVDKQTKWTVSEHKELFEKDIRAVVQAALQDAVSWDKLLEETSQDPELKELKECDSKREIHGARKENPWATV